MRQPEIAVLVSAFGRPDHLRRSLLSLEMQRHVTGLMEVVITDDGSAETVRPVVEDFARRVEFPVRFTTHAHDGYRLARCRNEGAIASTAPYLLFTDGDCILPQDHVRCHLEFRKHGCVALGDCYRLDREITDRITDSALHSGAYLDWIPMLERRRMSRKAFRAWCYQLLRIPMRPRMTGNNIGLWRTDFERVNGFDENFVGWGLEDRDLQLRLSRLGLRFQSILRRTVTCHLWHPPDATFSRNNYGTKNLEYSRRTEITTRCQNGLHERSQVRPELPDESVLLPGSATDWNRTIIKAGTAVLSGR
ncbi:MAG: glycosyltransferase [Planctomycetes bacterium]|nr:glycosyltransferase [Planctomycetota bacterium]